jgi:hypothetical protein
VRDQVLREYVYRLEADPESIADLPARVYHFLRRVGFPERATAGDVRPEFAAIVRRQSRFHPDRVTNYGGARTLAAIAVWLEREAIREAFNGFDGAGLS